MANPIIRPGVYFASFSEISIRSLPVEYAPRDTSVFQHTKPEKNVDNPRTSYHTWLESAGSKLDAVEQRKYLLKAIRSEDVEPVEVEPVKGHLSEKKEKATTTNMQGAITTNMQGAMTVRSKEKPTAGSKTAKSVKKMETADAVRLAMQFYSMSADDTPSDESSDLTGRVFPRDDGYIFDSSTIQNTVLPNTVQMKTYRDSAPLEEKKTSTVLTGVTPAVLTGVTPANEEQVFNAMLSLNWRDKDEAILTSQALNRVANDVLASAFPTMIGLADNLFLAIRDHTGALDDMETDERYNFLFHVIAKGNAMYYQTIADPDFCMYLLDQYQPLYTFMKKKLKLR